MTRLSTISHTISFCLHPLISNLIFTPHTGVFEISIKNFTSKTFDHSWISSFTSRLSSNVPREQWSGWPESSWAGRSSPSCIVAAVAGINLTIWKFSWNIIFVMEWVRILLYFSMKDCSMFDFINFIKKNPQLWIALIKRHKARKNVQQNFFHLLKTRFSEEIMWEKRTISLFSKEKIDSKTRVLSPSTAIFAFLFF